MTRGEPLLILDHWVKGQYPITFKLHMSGIDDKRRNPIDVWLTESKAKSRKYRGIFKVKSREKTRQVRKLVSTMEHKQFPKWGRKQVPGRVSVPCWNVTPVANAPWKPLVIQWRSSSVLRSLYWWKIRSASVRERLHIVELDHCIDHKSSWMTISSIPRGIPVEVAYLKVAWPYE